MFAVSVSLHVCLPVCRAWLNLVERAVCAGSFAAAFAKSLWRLVLIEDMIALHC